MMFQRVRLLRLIIKLVKRRQQSKPEEYEVDDDEAKPLVTGEVALKSLSTRDLEVAVGGDSVIPLILPSLNNSGCLQALSKAIQRVQDVPFVFFCKHDDMYMLNKAMLYIQKNEQTNKIIVVHCKVGNQEGPIDYASLTEHVKLIDILYPRVKISLLFVNAAFSPVTVEWLSQTLQIPINAMFISCVRSDWWHRVFVNTRDAVIILFLSHTHFCLLCSCP
jgi:hypothetical protein